MRIIKVIESTVWRNRITGARASRFGAVPWVNATDRDNWSLEPDGYTWVMSNGTVGIGRRPAVSRDEADRVMRDWNRAADERAAEYDKVMRQSNGAK